MPAHTVKIPCIAKCPSLSIQRAGPRIHFLFFFQATKEFAHKMAALNTHSVVVEPSPLSYLYDQKIAFNNTITCHLSLTPVPQSTCGMGHTLLRNTYSPVCFPITVRHWQTLFTAHNSNCLWRKSLPLTVNFLQLISLNMCLFTSLLISFSVAFTVLAFPRPKDSIVSSGAQECRQTFKQRFK